MTYWNHLKIRYILPGTDCIYEKENSCSKKRVTKIIVVQSFVMSRKETNFAIVMKCDHWLTDVSLFRAETGNSETDTPYSGYADIQKLKSAFPEMFFN